jgi:hypothetical protein
LVKLSAGSEFVVFLGLGVVGGGRVRAYTDSEVWVGRRASSPESRASGGVPWREQPPAATDVRFPGESQVGLDGSEFSEIEETDVLTGRLRSKKI